MTVGIILKILGFFLSWFGASKETQKQLLKLIEATRNDGLITVKSYEKFKSQKEKLIERAKEKEKQENGTTS